MVFETRNPNSQIQNVGSNKKTKTKLRTHQVLSFPNLHVNLRRNQPCFFVRPTRRSHLEVDIPSIIESPTMMGSRCNQCDANPIQGGGGHLGTKKANLQTEGWC